MFLQAKFDFLCQSKHLIHLLLHFFFVGDGVVMAVDSLRRVTCKLCDLEWMKPFVNHLGDVAATSGSPCYS